MTNDLGTPRSLPTALYDVVQTAAAVASGQDRLFSFKIINALPTWITTDLGPFSSGLIDAISKQFARSKSRESYVICTSSNQNDGQVEIDFTLSDLPGFKLSSDAKPFYSYKLQPFSERETFKHLLPPANDENHLRLADELLKGFCILVVDDSPEAVAYETRLIEKFGGNAASASSGEEAIEKALAKHYDLVLMDIKMPNGNGNDAMKTLVDNRYRMPVVALSAFSSVTERKESLQHGFSDYLSKPIVPEQLLRTIARLTNRSLPILKSESNSAVSLS